MGTQAIDDTMLEFLVLVIGALPLIVGLFAAHVIRNSGGSGGTDEPPPPEPPPAPPCAPRSPAPRSRRWRPDPNPDRASMGPRRRNPVRTPTPSARP